MKKLIILLIIGFLSCKKAEVKPIEPEPTPIVQPIPPKQERTVKIFGMWDELKTTLKGKQVIHPFKAFVGDTVLIEAEVNQYHNEWSTLDIHIYFDEVKQLNIKDVKIYKSTLIIK
jgi:hypothetical protein